jgi:hypothetical protein
VTTDWSVNATDKSVQRTVFDRLEQKANFAVAQPILFVGVKVFWYLEFWISGN